MSGEAQPCRFGCGHRHPNPDEPGAPPTCGENGCGCRLNEAQHEHLHAERLFGAFRRGERSEPAP